MPPQKRTTKDAPVPGTFVPWRTDRPNGWRSDRVGWLVMPTGCHIGQGGRDHKGYGRVRADGKKRLVHRVRYEREVGPIPDGMDLDHYVCDNGPGGCCNPGHVRPVTRRENNLRGETVAAVCAAKTHCPQGHSYSGDNLYAHPLYGWRSCRTCKRVKARLRAEARTEEQRALHREKGKMYKRRIRESGRKE